MKVVYMSMTGQTRRFVKKLNMNSLEIHPGNAFQEIFEPYIVIVPTYDCEVTEIMNDFIETGQNQQYLKGVAGSGNLNFNELFCYTAKDLAREYQVPLIHCFEFQGTDRDVQIIKEQVSELG